MHRTLRVYDEKGDFNIEIPEEARVTFGYFNPITGEKSNTNNWNGPGGQTMRTTALRIYTKERGEPELQLACFLGVKGFRDSKIKLDRIKKRMIVEQHMEDDGLGTITRRGSEKLELVVENEPNTYN